MSIEQWFALGLAGFALFLAGIGTGLAMALLAQKEGKK